MLAVCLFEDWIVDVRQFESPLKFANQRTTGKFASRVKKIVFQVLQPRKFVFYRKFPGEY